MAESLSPMDAQLFEEQAIGHLDAMFAVACRMTKNPSTAEDLVQDAFLKALKGRDGFQAGTNLKAWLLRIVTNTFLNHYTRGGLERETFEGPDAEAMNDGWMSAESLRGMRDAEALAVTPLLRDELLAALDELPDDFRLPVVLCDVEEMSYKEIADIMGCPVGTVMSRLHRGRKMLKSRLYEQALAMGIVREGVSEPANLDEYRAKKRSVAQ